MTPKEALKRLQECVDVQETLFRDTDMEAYQIIEKELSNLEMLHSQIRRFIKALDPQVNPNNPEEITIKGRSFNESNERDLFSFIERFIYENELKEPKKEEPLEESYKELNDEELIRQLKIKINNWKSQWSPTDGPALAYYHKEVSSLEDEAINRGLIAGWMDLDLEERRK